MSDDQSIPVPPGLTRMTVNLTERAAAALENAANRTGMTRTDVVNVAVMLLDDLAELGEHQGVYRVRADHIGERPLFLRVSRTPWTVRGSTPW